MSHRAPCTPPLRTALLAACAFSVNASSALLAQKAKPVAAAIATSAYSDSLRLFYVGRPVGWERFSIESHGGGWTLSSDFDYIDRGRRNHLAAALEMDATYAPQNLEVTRIGDTTTTFIARVRITGRKAHIARNNLSSEVDLPPVAFALSPYQPLAQHLALFRYWQAHKSPTSMALVPGGPVNSVHIERSGVDSLVGGMTPLVLTRYAIDGVVWGREYLWIDRDGRLAMFASAAGGLSFKAIRAELVPRADQLMTVASRAALKDLMAISRRTTPLANGSATASVALVGATVVDGTGGAAITDATVIVSHGRIVAVGPSATVAVPPDAKQVDVRGKTIIPGLWDSHAHLHQLEWTPVYLAAGVTTVRDMGNELSWITTLRTAVQAGRVNSPNIIAAGLVDGPGPNAFGALSAETPDEGRAIVRRYHALGFEQIKLYSLLAAPVVGAICDEAHKLGMIVTGHIPTSLTLAAAIDSGMDQVAHQPIRGEVGSDELKATIAHLVQKGTVIDPTSSWGEIGGHSQAEPLQNFQPVTQYLPPVFMQTRAAGWGNANPDTAAPHARLARSLAVTKALHDAGVPIVAGTDEGVPGFSVYREIELYAKAGFSNSDALRAATSVPAKAMRMDKELGTIEAGKRADLLVLDANPLERIENVRSVRLVMKDGKLFDSGALFRAIGFTAPTR